MSRYCSSDSVAGRLPDHLDLQVLHDAQAYLRCRQRRQTPSAAEEKAWQWFWETYEPRLAHWTVRYHVPRNDIKDCLQEILIDVMKRLPAFVSDGTQRGLCSWLRAVVHAKAVDLLRYRSRRFTRSLRPELGFALVTEDAGPPAKYVQRRLQEAVQQVLAVLRDQVSVLTYRSFYKHWIEGYTIKQIAAELNTSQRRVSCRIYKAKQKFRFLYCKLAPKDLLIDT